MVKMSDWGNTEDVLILFSFAAMGTSVKRPGSFTLALWGLRQLFV